MVTIIDIYWRIYSSKGSELADRWRARYEERSNGAQITFSDAMNTLDDVVGGGKKPVRPSPHVTNSKPYSGRFLSFCKK